MSEAEAFDRDKAVCRTGDWGMDTLYQLTILQATQARKDRRYNSHKKS